MLHSILPSFGEGCPDCTYHLKDFALDSRRRKCLFPRTHFTDGETESSSGLFLLNSHYYQMVQALPARQLQLFEWTGITLSDEQREEKPDTIERKAGIPLPDCACGHTCWHQWAQWFRLKVRGTWAAHFAPSSLLFPTKSMHPSQPQL